MCDYIAAIIGVGGTLLGTIVGWFLAKPRIKLSFSIQPQPDYDGSTPHDMRIKTSDSGYCVYCYNNGDKPFVADSFCLSYKRTIITQLGSDVVTIKPYDYYYCVINMQEYNNIIFHCREKN